MAAGTVRFVTTANCQLSVLNVTARADSVDNTFRDLESQGFTRSDRKYLVWMDANEICGIGESYDDPSARIANENNGAFGIPGMIAGSTAGAGASTPISPGARPKRTS